jgi:ribosomal protein S27E
MSAEAQKKCPFCGELISAAAIKCLFCGEFLQTPAIGVQQEAEAGNQSPVGHAKRTNTQALFEGNVSRIALVGPTAMAVI